MADPSKPMSRALNPAQMISAFLAFLLFAGLGGVLASGFAMPLVAAAGSLTTAGSQLFDELPEDLGSETLSDQSVMLDADGNLLARFYMWNRIVVAADQIDPKMGQTVVAIEDKRYYEHGGVDPEGMFRAVISNLTSKSTQGGSTLTQQYVKNVLVENARNEGDDKAVQEAYKAATETSIGRKLREAKLAIALEKTKSKDEILVGYMNIAQFGAGVWGVEAASQLYFGHSAAQLSESEAALLAGITNNPTKFDPLRNPEEASKRRDLVLKRLLDQGKIDQPTYEAALAIPVGAPGEAGTLLEHSTRSATGCDQAGDAAYFCAYVRDVIKNDPAFGKDAAARLKLLNQGGLTIKTTINRNMNTLANQAIMGAIPENDSSGVSGAISTVEPGTGKILAMTQNTTYGKPSEGNLRRTELNMNTDQAYGGSTGFQTGSTFKAFVLAEWLKTGHSLADIVDASNGQQFKLRDWTYDGCDDYRSNWDPKNIEGPQAGDRRISVLESTRLSVNTAFAYMASELNMCGILNTAQSMGMHRAAPDGRATLSTDPKSLALTPYPTMVLGANEVAPLTQAAAFATFASGGTYCKPIAITEVTDAAGNQLPIPQADCQEVLDPQVSATMNYALQQVVSSRGATGTAAALPGRPVAGKTGTANEDMAAWFVGYIPQAATAVWTGFSEASKPMMRITINGQYYSLVYGGKFAAPIWRSYMQPAVDGWEVKGWPAPNDRMVNGERRPVPNVIGKNPDNARNMLEAAGFGVRIGNPVNSDKITTGLIAQQSPAGTAKPGSVVTISPSSGPAAPPPPSEPPVDPNAPNQGDGTVSGGGGPGQGGGNGGGNNGNGNG